MSGFPWQNVKKRLPRPQIFTTPSSDDPDAGESQQTPSLMVIRYAGYQNPVVAVIFFSLMLTVRDIFIQLGSLVSRKKTKKHMSEMQKSGGSI